MSEPSDKAFEALAIAKAADAKAETALKQQMAHEEVCAERYSRINDTLGRIEGRLDGIDARWGRAQSTIIILLVAIVGFFVAPKFLA